MRIVLDFSDLKDTANGMRELAREIHTVRDKFLNRAGDAIKQRATNFHKFDPKSGNLQDAIEVQIRDDTVEISLNETRAPYATFVHEGTGLWGPQRRAYAIMPRDRQALFFDEHPVRRVIHPGTQPDPFLYDAADNVREHLTEIFSDEWDNLT